MHVPAGRAVRSVDVGMSVNPNQADFLVLPAIEFRDTGDRSRGNRMIAAQSDWNLARLQRFHDELRVLGAGRSNLLQILRVRIAFLFLLGNGHRNIPRVFDHVPQCLQPRFETSDAYCRGPHIHSAARLAQIERDADDANLARSDAGERWGMVCHNLELTYSRRWQNPLRVKSVQHSCKRNRLPHMLQPADPRDRPLDSHTKTRVGYAAVFPQIQIPLKRFFRQTMLVNAFE